MPPEWCMHKSRAGRLGLIPFVLSLRVLSLLVLSLTVLSLITGNYYAAYSAKKISPGLRARSTFLNVVMPILKAAVPRFQNNQHVQGFAVEISHHIMGKVMGVSMERPENLMVFLPRNGALKLLIAKDETARQAALLQGEVFLNAQPISIWLNDPVLPPAV